MEDKTKIIAGVGILAGAGILYLLMRKGGTPSPPPPVECNQDTDCPDWFLCVDGKCVPR